MGKFLSWRNALKCSFEVEEGRCDFPQDASAEKGLISPGEEHLLVFLELRQVPLKLRHGHQGPGPVASGQASLHASCEGSLGIPLQSVPGPMSSSGAESGT